MIFDGRAFAQKIETDLKTKVAKLPPLKLVAILDPSNAGSVTYTNLKQRFAQRIGVEFQKLETLDPDIEVLNADASLNGILLQLPFPHSQKYIDLIDKTKDIDGLRDDSPCLPAVVEAVKEVLKSQDQIENKKIIVVGAKGAVGRKLVKELRCQGMDKDDFDPSRLLGADIIISATGQEGLITPDMVKDGVVALDLGFPKGDFAPEVASKAAFFTPVPGGIGPVTVACLFANLVGNG